jgi:5-methylcytosine-specific restriction endonuclease McrA
MSSYQHRLRYWTSYRDPELRKGRTGRPYKAWRAYVLRDPVPICGRCGRPIDKSLPWQHPGAATAGHIIPLSRGGAPLDRRNGQPEHRRCNLSAGARMAGDAPRPLKVADRRW